MASTYEQQALARAGMDKGAAFCRRQIKVARESVGAFGCLAEQDPDVALLDDRLAVVGAEELDDVLGRKLQPCVIVAGGSGQLLDEGSTRGLAHHLPGLVDDDELASEIDPDGVPEHCQRGELRDRPHLGIAERRKSDDDELLIAQGRRTPREDKRQGADRPALEAGRNRCSPGRRPQYVQQALERRRRFVVGVRIRRDPDEFVHAPQGNIQHRSFVAREVADHGRDERHENLELGRQRACGSRARERQRVEPGRARTRLDVQAAQLGCQAPVVAERVDGKNPYALKHAANDLGACGHRLARPGLP